ncbi:MAG: tRNA pseudouridine(38-40) synthase TruA [Fimbriimonadaceae bacterium]
MSTRRIKLVVAYDGTDFCGWAPQRGQRTVHSTLKKAVRQVSGEAIEITGASRTDSGAHAKGQVVHFDQKSKMPVENWVRALGDVLPADIAAIAASEEDSRFHARFSAQSRTYRYVIATGPRDPFRDRFAHWNGRLLDSRAMQKAANFLVGTRDFEPFSQDLPPGTNFVRTIIRAEVRSRSDRVELEIVGNAFLRGMMRRIAGALWQVGRHKWEPERIRDLASPETARTGERPPVLPAHGLTLLRVNYGRWPKDWRTEEEQDSLDNQGNDDE